MKYKIPLLTISLILLADCPLSLWRFVLRLNQLAWPGCK